MSGLLKFKPGFQRETQRDSKPKRAFDAESGLVYTQTSCNGSKMTADWAWKTIGSSREHAHFRSSGPGCSSLKNMAIRGLLLHSCSITAESLENVPWSIGQTVWHRILARSQLDSLSVWRAFATTYPDELDAPLKRRQHNIREPEMGFDNYMTPLISLSFRWLTFLTVSNITCPRSDLISLSRMPNLGVLTVGKGVLTPDVGLEDGIVRAWSDAAAEAGAFSMLRVLNLQEQKHCTPRIFSYLYNFPCLSLLNLDACSIGIKDKGEALKCGWRYKTGPILNDFLPETGKMDKTWDSAVHACFRAAGAYGIKNMTAEGVEAINSLPTLHFSLGTAPTDAAFNASAKFKLQCFDRLKDPAPSRRLLNDLKRPMSEASQSSRAPRKKPAIRASKQQSAGDLFLGLS